MRRSPDAMYWLLLSLIFLAGCGSREERAPVIGEAFAGPATLNLRQEISLRSKPVATVKHGDKLEIIQRRRRFLKVRSPQGIEGWTDARQLLSPEQMVELRGLAERSAKLPSQGKATPFEPLNVHTEPSRQSPSFYQVAEKESVEVIATGCLTGTIPLYRRWWLRKRRRRLFPGSRHRRNAAGNPGYRLRRCRRPPGLPQTGWRYRRMGKCRGRAGRA